MTEQYSFEEISKHTSDDDCWIVIHGKVYNVTDFLDAHPGGPEYLTDFSGCKSIISTSPRLYAMITFSFCSKKCD